MNPSKKIRRKAIRRKVGRPEKTIDDLPKGWQLLMKNIAKQGGSAVSTRVQLGISKDLWYRLINESSEFSATVDVCNDLCQHWWETQGRKMTVSGIGSSNVWRFNMQNRFGWKDKTEMDLGGQKGNPIGIDLAALTDEELEQAERLANAARRTPTRS